MADLASELEALIGKNDENSAPKYWLDTGFPPLNKIVSGSYFGGFPVGRLIEIFGPPSAGKTAIATSAMICAQKAGGIAAFMDHERSFDLRLAKKLGLDDTPGRWIFKTPETFEESITVAGKVAQMVRAKKHIPEEAPIIFVFDSLAAMVPKSVIEKDATELNMNDNTALARATSSGLKHLQPYCERYNMTAIFLNQSRTKIGVMYGDPTTTPGGSAPEFYSSVRIKLSGGKITEGSGSSKEVAGKEITAETVKNKVNRPFLKTNWDFRFREDGSGYFDVVGSLVDHMCKQGFIEQSGARVTWTDGKSYYKSQLVKKIEDEGLYPELLDILRAAEAK